MSSKSFFLLALLAVVVLLISSEVAARDLAEPPTGNKNGEVATETTKAELKDAKYGYGGGYGNYGGGHGIGGYYRGYYGGRGGYYGGYYGGRGGYYGGYGGGCAYGCCLSSDYYGMQCRRCCSYPGEPIIVAGTHADHRN